MSTRLRSVLGAVALITSTATLQAGETIKIAVGHKSMCTDTYTAGIDVKEIKLLEKHLTKTGKYKDAK